MKKQYARLHVWLYSLSKSRFQSSAHILLAIALGMVAGCQQIQISAPAIQVPEQQTIVWHDLLSPNAQSSNAFMSNALGWKLSPNSPYSLIRDDSGSLIGGLIDTSELGLDVQTGGWLLSIQTEDLQSAVGRVQDAGGTVLRAIQSYPDRGSSAIVQDPQGVVFELVQLNRSPNAEQTNQDLWIWHELITNNPQESAEWYASVFQLQYLDMEDDRKLLMQGDIKIATISENPFEQARNQWIPVVSVSDMNDTLLKVTSWGGSIALAPNSNFGNGQLALIQDPSGAAMLLQQKEVAQ